MRQGICYLCGQRKRTGLHHINPRSEGGSDESRNLLELCTKCHDWAEDRPWKDIQHRRTGKWDDAEVTSENIVVPGPNPKTHSEQKRGVMGSKHHHFKWSETYHAGQCSCGFWFMSSREKGYAKNSHGFHIRNLRG